MNLLTGQSSLISSLQRTISSLQNTIDGLNVKLENFENGSMGVDALMLSKLSMPSKMFKNLVRTQKMWSQMKV